MKGKVKEAKKGRSSSKASTGSKPKVKKSVPHNADTEAGLAAFERLPLEVHLMILEQLDYKSLKRLE